MKLASTICCAALAALAILTPDVANATSYGIVTESVDNFGCGGQNQDPNCNCTVSPPVCTGNPFACCNDLPNSDTNGVGVQKVLAGGSSPLGYTLYAFTDGNVWDSDFVDPDLNSSNSKGEDTYNFDSDATGSFNGNASYGAFIAYFTGHGVTNNECQSALHTCTSASECTDPDVSAYPGLL